MTATENDPSVRTGQEKYTLWLSDGISKAGSIIAENQDPVSSVAVVSDEVLYSCVTHSGHALWCYGASGLKQIKDDGVENLQKSGEYFCYTHEGSLYRGSGSLATCQNMGQHDRYDHHVSLSSDGTVYSLDGSTDHGRIYEIDGEDSYPVQDYDGFVSNFFAAGGYTTALVKQNFGTADV